ncbi:MAG: helix-turn-helix transcriptional regulator [Hyphomicrobiaceae bacterium]|nr:helix-turn-helix transcriptional regulator [Hyphomicrobiaceae bacterium]
MAGKKAPNPVDVHVGNRVRMRRMMLGLSQEKLGEALGVTFQQVQKYEKGLNRIGAGRLQTIAQVLQVPVSFFYEDAPGSDASAGSFAEGSSTSYVSDLLTTSEGLELTRAFLKVEDTKLRRRIVDLVKAISEAKC